MNSTYFSKVLFQKKRFYNFVLLLFKFEVMKTTKISRINFQIESLKKIMQKIIEFLKIKFSFFQIILRGSYPSQ
jgi:hypothetical protein